MAAWQKQEGSPRTMIILLPIGFYTNGKCKTRNNSIIHDGMKKSHFGISNMLLLRCILLVSLCSVVMLYVQHEVLQQVLVERELKIQLRLGFGGLIAKGDSRIMVVTNTQQTDKKLSYESLACRIAHAGPQTAYNENVDELGYIADPTVKRRYFHISSKDYKEVCAPPGQATDEDVVGYRALTEQVKVAKSLTTNHHSATTTTTAIFCLVYTYDGGKGRVEAILETWGQHCDGFLAASTFTNATMNTVRIPGTTGDYNDIWQKLRAMLFYTFWNYRDDFDFFHVSGDDAFVIVENLKAYLTTSPSVLKARRDGAPGNYSNKPLYIGHWVHRQHFEYAGGGPGYTLNRAALAAFMGKIYLNCDATLQTPFEDLQFGKCWKRYMHQNPINAKDDRNKSLYFGYNPLVACQDVEGCSANSIAFHHARTPAIMRRWYKLLYRRHLCDCTSRLRTEPGAVLLPPNVTSSYNNKKKRAAARLSKFQQKAKAQGK
jgi:glycoprotein-N-acetylgalactosamine 3-beta-galactosyltransferase